MASKEDWKRWFKIKLLELNCEKRIANRMPSGNKFTRIKNDPTVADNGQALIIAEELGMHAYELLQQFGLGSTKMTQEEKNLLCSHYALQSAVLNEQEQGHSQAA